MPITDNGHLPALRSAYNAGRLSFYLGAGVSKASGLPGWEELVQALYFTTLNDESYINDLKSYPNYLFAIAEWVLKQQNEPLDITIRKIKQWYPGRDFIRMIADTLYAGMGRNSGYSPHLSTGDVGKNQTLAAVIDCCDKSAPGVKGLRSIVTYNYDNLVELGLKARPGLNNKFQTIYKRDQSPFQIKYPSIMSTGIFPYEDTNVNYDEIIFSEEQYNQAFQDPFFWGNMVQVNHFTNDTGLMIGLSLSDRNIRRILDAIRTQPLPRDNYILLKSPRFPEIQNPSPELDLIRSKAGEYLNRFPDAAMKTASKEPAQIQNILKNINRFESGEFQRGFENLGVKTILFDEYTEIGPFLNSISA